MNEPWVQGTAGPFYRPNAPFDAQSLPGAMYDSATLSANAELLNIRIRIATSGATPWQVFGARVEIWHADEDGHYDDVGYAYRRTFPTSGLYAAIDVTTLLPGILHFNGSPVYRHVHLQVTPPQPFRGGFNNISDWRGEIKLVLPPWTDPPVPSPEDPRTLAQLSGPNTVGHGGRTWFGLQKTIYLDFPDN